MSAIASFFVWLGCMLGVCALIISHDWILKRFARWREQRAAKKQAAAAAKRHADMLRWGLACYPRESRRIPNSSIDPARRTGQFSVHGRPAAYLGRGLGPIRDVKRSTR